MIQFPPYKLEVKVTNNFPPKSNVKIIVCYHNSPSNATKDDTCYTISPTSMTFYLRNTGEYLEISLASCNQKKNPPTYPYYITAGPMAMAKCEFINDNGKYEPTPPDLPPFPEEFGLEDGFYPGGVWKVDGKKKSNSWKLTIKEYKVDPEKEPVEIGESVPG